MAFHVGQKVVCVDDTPIEPVTGCRGSLDGLTKGCVYTIRKIQRSRLFGLGLQLHELRHRINTPYAAVRFRPAVERKTDISIFTEMLKPKQRELIGNY